jgi:alcohol dehydrogenase
MEHTPTSRKSLLLTSARHLEWITEDLASPGPNEVLVQTHNGAISIGSELPLYCGTARSNKSLYYPRMTGYESLGIVLACGPSVQYLHPGDRIVAFYGYRTHAIVPEKKAIAVPSSITDDLALLLILTCDAAKGVRKVAPGQDERILITGAGTMGLLTLFILKTYGIPHIDMVEPVEERHALALTFGASHVLHPIDMPQHSETYTSAFECSSRPTAFTIMQNNMRREGRICILADGNREPLVLAPAFHEKELSIVASSDGWDYHTHAAWYFHELQQRPSHLERLFDLHIARSDLVTTFEQLATGAIHPVKVLIHYDM